MFVKKTMVNNPLTAIFFVENVAIGDRGRLNQKHQAARMEESSRRFGRPITKQVQSTVDPR